MFGIVKWRYNNVLWDGSDYGLAGPSRSVMDARGVVDGRLGRFGTGRFVHMQSASVVASEGGGDALLAFQGSAEGGPTDVMAGFTQAGADHPHGLVGDDSDEQVTLGPDGLVVMDRTQAGVRIRGAEDRLDVGRDDMGAPQGGFDPIGPVGSQAVHTPGWVIIESCGGRRENRMAVACCPAGSVSSPV